MRMVWGRLFYRYEKSNLFKVISTSVVEYISKRVRLFESYECTFTKCFDRVYTKC